MIQLPSAISFELLMQRNFAIWLPGAMRTI